MTSPKITTMPGSVPNIYTVMAMMKEEVPDAKDGVLIVFDAEGNAYMESVCSSQQLALAGARLLAQAARDVDDGA